MTYKAEIPYGTYWSTPFARWQGAFANLHSLRIRGARTKRELARRNIPREAIEHGVLGISVPQKHSFYGCRGSRAWPALGHVGGPTVMQACATGVRALLAAAQEIETGAARRVAGRQLRPHVERPASLLSRIRRAPAAPARTKTG